MTKLVIVESPAKAKTIQKYLPSDFVVRASSGHVRDLPDNAGQMPEKYRGESWASLGVDVDNGFDAVYVVKDPRSRKALAALKKDLKDADILYLATDEDREGEAISWHLVEALKPKVEIKRMVFHEITKSAIDAALNDTRGIDYNLVAAQETRRILDRLVGYPLSLLVAKKIKYGLSAGRVQSVAMRLLVLRERDRRRFRMGTYWDLKAQMLKDKQKFDATLIAVGNKRIATGKDFDENTGQIIKGKDVLLLDEATAKRLADKLVAQDWTVSDVVEKQYTTSPKPPFITSTLQQEASRKLGMSASAAMSVAQGLYENGFITYMRTDSVNLSQQAITAARNAAQTLYGPEYVPAQPRVYKGKTKGAQEAHEAIRPSGDEFVHPSKSGLKGQDLKLYDLIWKRTVACQMEAAKKTSLRVDLVVADEGQPYTFRANGNRIDFAGFMRAYVEGLDDPDAALDDQEVLLPALALGDKVKCKELDPLRHETKPPARFTEASLVKALEEEGIGRPSTYASIMKKLTSDERYARKSGNTLIPTYLAFAVTEFLENYFAELVDLKFTANMEDELDEIAEGKCTKVEYLHNFYRKEGAFNDQVGHRDETIDPDTARIVHLEDFPATLKVGRYGPYVQVDDNGELKTVNVPDDVAPADLTYENILEWMAERAKAPDTLGTDPESGLPILIMNGRYGVYLQLGERSEDNPKPKTTSLPKGVTLEEMTVDKATQLFELPRKLGKHPEDKKVIEAAIGRFGPYIKHNKEYRSLQSEGDVFTITLDEAVKLLSEPKVRGRRTQAVLRELGTDPASGDKVNIHEGRYGPYVKLGKTNASLPKDVKPEELTLEKALELIEQKNAG
ncbi:MAG: type I DNA topoisomerase [Bradymonadaceae bacterium]|nr:type I DNA topoisomerase [Lujinxingiaceae bacterium]